MKIFVPYTKLERATRLSVAAAGHFRAVLTDGDGAYVDFMAERWRVGESFINVEHDAVPWPGALRKLWECPEPWCAYGHTEDVDFTPGAGYETSLHCCKFDASLIARVPWMMATLRAQPDLSWGNLATRITEFMWAHGIFVHQHYPPIPNLGRAE